LAGSNGARVSHSHSVNLGAASGPKKALHTNHTLGYPQTIDMTSKYFKVIGDVLLGSFVADKQDDVLEQVVIRLVDVQELVELFSQRWVKRIDHVLRELDV
jgi:hypothetical protein